MDVKEIRNARLVWIYSTEHNKGKKKNIQTLDNSFISLIDAGDRSEYSSAYFSQIKRRELISDVIVVDGCELKLTVVGSEYSTYKCDLIHIYAELNSAPGITQESFAKLINGSSILEQSLVSVNALLKDKLKSLGIIINSSAFLINQIRETYPELPKNISVDSKDFIQSNLAPITQFLLRSDTDSRFLSADNHQDYLINTSSFKGSVDLCSASTMIQFYFSDLESLSENKIIDADVRLSWMCSVITMVNIQSMILKNAIKSIDTMATFDANKKVNKTKELKNVLVSKMLSLLDDFV